MADIYADATTGRDVAGRGTLADPFRSITFGISEAVRLYGTELTTIHIGPGMYNRAGGETFPILVPQNISLIGSGADRTIIDFERSVGDVDYVGIQAGGNEVSGLTIYGRPSDPGACELVEYILLREDGTRIHDIAIREAPGVPEGEIGLGYGIFIQGVSASIERISVSRCSQGVTVTGHEGTVIRDSNFDNNRGGISVGWSSVAGYSAAEIRNNDFDAGNWCGVAIETPSSALVEGNRFHNPSFAGVISGRFSAASGSEQPRIADNEFEVGRYYGVCCQSGEMILEGNYFQIATDTGTAVALGKEIRVPSDEPASPLIRNNEIIRNVLDVTASTHAFTAIYPLIRIGGNFSPVVQENSFAFEGGSWGLVILIKHDARPDLGGGPLGSTGGNRLAGGWIEIGYDTESLPGEVFARNNYWRRVPPERGADIYTPREYFQTPWSEPPFVVVHTEGAMPL